MLKLMPFFTFLLLPVFAIFISISCGEREKEDKEKVSDSFIGSWQQTYDLSVLGECDPNLDCKCADVFNFYQGNTFDRNLRCDYKKGYYELNGSKMKLTYISELPQIFDFTIAQNEMTLVKGDIEYRYIRKPYKVRMEEAPTTNPSPSPSPSTGVTR